MGPDGPSVQDFYDRLKKERRDEEYEYEQQLSKPEYSNFLKRAFDVYSAEEDFQPGDLVQWKEFMKNKRFPAVGAPAIFIGTIADAKTHDSDGDSVEVENVMLGFLDGDMMFRTFPFAGARFTRWSE